MQLCREAVYGTDKKVKDRIFKRMYFLATKVKDEPEVRELKMLHANDYANMSLGQLQKTLTVRKQKDKALTKSMRLETILNAEERREKCAEETDECWIDDETCLQSSHHENNNIRAIGITAETASGGKDTSQRKNPFKDGKPFLKRSCNSLEKDEYFGSKQTKLVNHLFEKDDDELEFLAAQCKTPSTIQPKISKIKLSEGEMILNQDDDSEIPSTDGYHEISVDAGSLRKSKAVYSRGLTKLQKSNTKNSMKDTLKYDPKENFRKLLCKNRTKIKNIVKEAEQEESKVKNFLASYDDSARKKRDLEQMQYQEALNSVKILAKSGVNAMVNHTALLMAKADDENYDLSKYRKKAIAELDEDYMKVDLENPSGSSPRNMPSTSQVDRLMEEMKDDHLYPNQMACPRLYFSSLDD